MILILVVAPVVGFVLGIACANLIMQEIKCEVGGVVVGPDSIKSNPAPSGEELDEKDFVSEWEVVDDFGLTIKLRYYRTEVEGEFVHKVIRNYSSVILPEGGILVDGDDEHVARKPISEDTAEWIEEYCMDANIEDVDELRSEMALLDMHYRKNKHAAYVLTPKPCVEVAAKRCNKIWKHSSNVWAKIEDNENQ